VELDISEIALEWIIKNGYDRSYGARPLKRVIQRNIEDQLSKQIISGEISEGNLVEIDVGKNGELSFESNPVREIIKSN